jgi:hypothetical protein
MSKVNPYKCESHRLDLICPGCVKAWISRHDRMLGFIKQIVHNHTKFKETSDMSLEGYKVLKEIGKV